MPGPMRSRRITLALAALLGAGCGATAPTPLSIEPTATPPERPAPRTCGGAPLVVEFVDAGQALAVLVALPDGKHVLVDAGEAPARVGCGAACGNWHAHVMDETREFLRGSPLDLLWITHPHSDHVGGALDVVEAFVPPAYVDNGQGDDRRDVASVLAALESHAIPRTVVEPGRLEVPLRKSKLYELSAVVPSAWPTTCAKDPNDCSIGLRIDYCDTSVLLVGDAERREEAALDVRHATLLQVGHHGSDTSSTEAFLARVRPTYAVISAAGRDEGTNGGFCHPRVGAIERLNALLGGPGADVVDAFDGALPCGRGTDEGWRAQPTSERLWVTSRDGDVTLVSTGDGAFTRRAP